MIPSNSLLGSTITSERVVLTYAKHNKKGKPIGKPVVEVLFTFSTAMNPGTVENAGNYNVNVASTRKLKKKLVTTYNSVGLSSVTLDPSDTVVTLVTSVPKSKFAKGGQVVIAASGVRSAAGVSLGGPSTFTIGAGGGSISG